MSGSRQSVFPGNVLPPVFGEGGGSRRNVSLKQRVASALETLGTWRWSATVIVALASLLWLPRLLGPIDLRYDAGVYYSLGTSLATGQGYRILSEPGAPEGVQYPPGLPALVALHQLVLGSTDPEIVAPWLRISFAGIFLVYGLAVLALARVFLTPMLAVAATVLCLLQANTYLVSDLLFTEIPFALVSVLFLLALRLPRGARRKPWLRESLAWGLASVGFLLRSAGIALLATWVIEALLRRNWRLAVVRALLAIVPFGLWQAHVMSVQSSDEYLNPAYEYQRASYQFYNVTYGENMAYVNPFQPELGRIDGWGVVKRVAANLAMVPTSLGEAVSETNGFWRWALGGLQESPGDERRWANRLSRAPLLFLAALTVGGLAMLGRRRAWGVPVLVVVSVALVCTTPWPEQFGRYLTPLIPFLTVATVLGAVGLDRFLRSRRSRLHSIGRGALVGFLLVVFAVQTHTLARIFHVRHFEPATFVQGQGLMAPRLFYYDGRWSSWYKAAAWINMRAPREVVVATTSPHYFNLLTGLKAVLPPMEADPQRARELLESVPVSYVIVDERTFLDLSVRYALPALESAPTKWRLAYQSGGARVYQRVVAE